MASKENKSRKAKHRVNMFNALNRTSRIVNFGAELLTDSNCAITVDSGPKVDGNVTESENTEVDNRIIKEYVIASVRNSKVESDKLSSILQDTCKQTNRRPTSAISSMQTVGERKDNHSARRTTQNRNSDSYSRKITELGNTTDYLEDALDDAGVFRTDGVGGKSVCFSKATPKHRLRLQETDDPSCGQMTARPSSLSLTCKNNCSAKHIMSDEKRTSSTRNVSDIRDKDRSIRNKNKRDLLTGLTKHKKSKNALKTEKDEKLDCRIDTGGKASVVILGAWSDKEAEMVDVATQTEEEYTGELDHIDLNDGPAFLIPESEENLINEVKTSKTVLCNGHNDYSDNLETDREMEEAMKITGQKLTKAQIKGIKAAFDAIDLNHDGKISTNKLRRACKNLGILLTRDELDEIMSEADTSKNGTIEYDEFEKHVGKQLVIANYKTKQLRDMFRKFDKDGDGYITAEEIRIVFRESGVELDDEEISELVAEADENGDGVISFEEFVNSLCEKDW